HKIEGGDTFAADYDHCKGCGICASECPKDAIEMVLEEK
ncbi:MAG: 4Fe-4S binding protein, partial [Methanosarcinales archaeon]|nr:4Fe-4S binding protein [Methanosarcinales archaeon]